MTGKAKRPRDANQLAKFITYVATGDIEDRRRTPEKMGKDPAAVAFGRRGGLKGGKARANALSPEDRLAITKRTALKRWNSDE